MAIKLAHIFEAAYKPLQAARGRPLDEDALIQLVLKVDRNANFILVEDSDDITVVFSDKSIAHLTPATKH